MCASTYILETFGCQMNVLDSQLVEGQLRSLGLRPVESEKDADLILFNTCSVRQHAEDKVLSRLGRLKPLKRRRPEVVIGVLGCMAERQKEDLFVSTPHLDLICGPGELHRLPELLGAAWDQQRHVTALAGSQSRKTEALQRALEYDSLEALDLSRGLDRAHSTEFPHGVVQATSDREPPSATSAAAPAAEGHAARRNDTGRRNSVLQSYIRVQRGCDKFCTYCVVPFTRGPERSRPAEHIVEEARRLADLGCREITLLGQTVNSYVHQDAGRPLRFTELLERVQAVPGIDRLRFVTSFPADWDEDIFRVMRDYPKLCPYLHIPAQSGSDRILKAMKRGYTVADYLRLMDLARKYIPDIALAGDFIVGFCGETEDDFQATVELVQRVEYKSIFVFKYSPRPGTAADRGKPDDVAASVKLRRNNELLAVQGEIGLRQKERLVGQSVEVLVEGYSKLARKRAAGPQAEELRADSEQGRGAESTTIRPGKQLVGRTPHDLIVVFDGEPAHIGALINVQIKAASALTLFGQVQSVVSAAPNGAGAAPPAEGGATGLRLPLLGG